MSQFSVTAVTHGCANAARATAHRFDVSFGGLINMLFDASTSTTNRPPACAPHSAGSNEPPRGSPRPTPCSETNTSPAGLSLASSCNTASAGAKKYQVSGTWFMRNGQVFIPLQFALSDPTHKSMGTGTLFRGPATQPFHYHFPPTLPLGPMGTQIPVTAIFGPGTR